MKRTILVSTAAVTALAAVGIARRHRRLAAVAEELRSPRLYVPGSIRNDATVRLIRRAPMPAAAVPEGVEVRTEMVVGSDGRPDSRILVYERTDRQRPSGALLWIHGGGFVMGVPEMGQELCGRIADQLGILVVNVDYRLAPEDPFPAGLDDCAAALQWLAAHAEELGVDPARIAVGGDSAGGGLAACLAQRALDEGGPALCFQLLQYPMLDDRTALRPGHDAIFWTNASNRYSWQAYLGHPLADGETRDHAVAARREDLSGLPPAWIGIGDIDLFHDESLAYAERLRAAGVPCETLVVPGMYHGAERFSPTAPSMAAFVDAMVAALGTALTARPAG